MYMPRSHLENRWPDELNDNVGSLAGDPVHARARQFVAPRGAAVVYDSRLWHRRCDERNHSGKDRVNVLHAIARGGVCKPMIDMTVEAAAFLASTIPAEITARELRDVRRLVVLGAEVGLDDADGLLVDARVLVVLQVLELLDAVGLVDEVRRGHAAEVAHLEDRLERVERDGDDLRLRRREERAERLDDAVLHEREHVVLVPPAQDIGHDPRRLLLHVPVARVELVHDELEERRVRRDRGDLRRRARGDVGHEPARLLADGLARRREQRGDVREHARVERGLRLRVVARDDVAERPERGRHDLVRRVAEQGAQGRRRAVVDDALDARLVAVAQVRQRPARVHERVDVVGPEQADQDGDRRREARDVGLGRAAAQVRQGPRRVAQEARRRGILEVRDERLERARGEHGVAALRRVAGDVAEAPDALLADVAVGRLHELDHRGHDARVDDGLRLVRRRDVRQRPGRLELELGHGVVREEPREDGHDARGEDGVDGRLRLDAQELAPAPRRRDDDRRVLRLDLVEEPRHVRDRRPLRRGRVARVRLRREHGRDVALERAPLREALLALVLPDLQRRVLAAAPRGIEVAPLLVLVAPVQLVHVLSHGCEREGGGGV
mmetsp:Transcript_22564/g.74814  ORF Transcript_22564/g.74814 Transcript_22564/m.74814 type:complete len:613 (+) Transcript_22564:694-2532(+)